METLIVILIVLLVVIAIAVNSLFGRQTIVVVPDQSGASGLGCLLPLFLAVVLLLLVMLAVGNPLAALGL